MSDTVWLAIIGGVVAIASAVIAKQQIDNRKKNGNGPSNGRRPVEKSADESYGQIIKAYREEETARRAELLELRLRIRNLEEVSATYNTRADTLQDQIDKLIIENAALSKTIEDQKTEIARLWMLLGHSARDAAVKAAETTGPAAT